MSINLVIEIYSLNSDRPRFDIDNKYTILLFIGKYLGRTFSCLKIVHNVLCTYNNPDARKNIYIFFLLM